MKACLGGIRRHLQLYYLEPACSEQLRPDWFAWCRRSWWILSWLQYASLTPLPLDFPRNDTINNAALPTRGQAGCCVYLSLCCTLCGHRHLQKLAAFKKVTFLYDGHTYERSAISAWLAKHDTSPFTKELMPTKLVYPSHTI